MKRYRVNDSDSFSDWLPNRRHRASATLWNISLTETLVTANSGECSVCVQVRVFICLLILLFLGFITFLMRVSVCCELCVFPVECLYWMEIGNGFPAPPYTWVQGFNLQATLHTALRGTVACKLCCGVAVISVRSDLISTSRGLVNDRLRGICLNRNLTSPMPCDPVYSCRSLFSNYATNKILTQDRIHSCYYNDLFK